MTDQDGANAPDPYHIQSLVRRNAKIVKILRGDDFPTHADRCGGMPPYMDNPRADLRSIAARELDRIEHDDDLVAALTHLQTTPTRWSAQQARQLLLALDEFETGRTAFAIDWCCCWLGDGDAINRIVAYCLYASGRNAMQRVQNTTFAMGLKATRGPAGVGTETEYEPGDAARTFERGVRDAASFSTEFPTFQAAAKEAAEEDVKSVTMTAEDRAIAALMRLAEDRAEVVVDDGIPDFATGGPETKMIMSKFPTGTTAWKRDLYKGYSGIAGVPLPMIGRGDVAAHMKALVAGWPHAADVIETMLSDLIYTESVRFEPTLLVGDPGTGKSSLARAIAEQVGVPVELTALGGVADGSLMGTSAQYSSAREHTVLQLIKRTGVANPLMIWDEVDKASHSRHNGSALDALLGILEIDQARNYRDLALEVTVDLSMVSHIATANSVDTIPGPLRDRMRILRMPNPAWQHLPAITTRIIERIAKARKLDPRWLPPLAEDEIDVVKHTWSKGSMRQLERIVLKLVDGRGNYYGRA